MFNSVVKSLIYNTITTWNGVTFFKSNTDPIVDLFYKTSRDMNYNNFAQLATDAWNISPLLTLKIIAYIRDCRGGKGERQCGRRLLHWLANEFPENAIHNLQFLIIECGRYDDLTVLLNTPCEEYMFQFIANQLENDLNNMRYNRPVSLLAKWIPSERKSFDNATRFFVLLVRFMKITPRTLRKKYLSPLRAYLKVVETFMCNNQWDLIDFNNVPSKAMKIYGKNAFERHVPEKFIKYKTEYVSMNTKLNSMTLFPHEIIKYYMQNPTLAELKWKEIIKNCKDHSNINNTLVLPDVSCSMEGFPMFVSIAMGLLTSELEMNKFKNLVLTFEKNPQFYHIEGNTLLERYKSLKSAPWERSTNLQLALESILNMAIIHNLETEQIPKRLLVISDMQLNEADNNFINNYQQLVGKYKKTKYTIPHIIFWNINEQINNAPLIEENRGVTSISGFNEHILRAIISGNNLPTPYEIVLSTVNIPRYDPIVYVQTL